MRASRLGWLLGIAGPPTTVVALTPRTALIFSSLVAEFLVEPHEVAVQYGYWFPLDYLILFERRRFSALFIPAKNLLHPLDAQGVPCIFVLVPKPHGFSENICLLKTGIALFCLQGTCNFGDVFQGPKVRLQFIVETTFEAAAMTTEFARI